MAVLNAYLNFNGNCEEAFNFYKSVFGGDFTYVGRFGDMPEGEQPIPDEMKNAIMHISLPISKETILMGSDTGGEWASQLVVGNNVSLSITALTKEEADRLFEGLAAGGNITMPIGDVFWGDYFGMLTDKYGVNWMVGFNEEYSKGMAGQ